MIQNLDPQIVWKNFYELTRIPRPSKHEELAVEYMYNWGISHGLETIKDAVGNIVIRKPATPGCENMKGVILQGLNSAIVNSLLKIVFRWVLFLVLYFTSILENGGKSTPFSCRKRHESELNYS